MLLQRESIDAVLPFMEQAWPSAAATLPQRGQRLLTALPAPRSMEPSEEERNDKQPVGCKKELPDGHKRRHDDVGDHTAEK